MGAAVGVSRMGVSMVYMGPASQGGSQDPERRCGRQVHCIAGGARREGRVQMQAEVQGAVGARRELRRQLENTHLGGRGIKGEGSRGVWRR